MLYLQIAAECMLLVLLLVGMFLAYSYPRERLNSPHLSAEAVGLHPRLNEIHGWLSSGRARILVSMTWHVFALVARTDSPVCVCTCKRVSVFTRWLRLLEAAA